MLGKMVKKWDRVKFIHHAVITGQKMLLVMLMKLSTSAYLNFKKVQQISNQVCQGHKDGGIYQNL